MGRFGLDILNRLANRIAYGESDPFQPLRQSGDLTTGTWYGTQQFDTSRVDYGRARSLYRNTLPQYKLGAHFAKPIINYTAGFMGVPHFNHAGGKDGRGEPAANKALDDFTERYVTRFLTANRNVLRDGDAFVRIDHVPDRWGSGKMKLDIRLIHPAWCAPTWNPISGDWDSLTITYPVYPQTKRDPQTGRAIAGVNLQYTIVETLTPDTIVLSADDKAPPEVKAQYPGDVVPNPWGFIPVVQFRNEPEDVQIFGASDLEPLEPLFRAYHDTMIVGNSGIRLFAKPKVKFKLKDVDSFMRNNFPGWKPGQPVNFQNRELFLFSPDEDAEYLTAEPGSAGVQILLELLFYCIVQASQVPEFVLGTAVSSSKASVDSQLGPFVKTIERKRAMFSDSYTDLMSMFLAMAQKTPEYKIGSLDSYDVEVGWPEIAPKDESMTATVIMNLMSAFQTGVTAGLISLEAANEFLRDFIPTMLPWLDSSGNEGERRRVMDSLAWLERVQAGGLTPPDQENALNQLPQTTPVVTGNGRVAA